MDDISDREKKPGASEKALDMSKMINFKLPTESDKHGLLKTSGEGKTTHRSRTLHLKYNRSINNDSPGGPSTLPRRTGRQGPRPTLGRKSMKVPSVHFKEPWRDSPLWPARVCSMRRQERHSNSNHGDSSSVVRGILTVEMQSNEPNFIGDAYYYDLRGPANRKALEGDYTIVYTRPVGKPFNVNDNRCAIFPPSDERMIKVQSTVPRNSSANAPIRGLLEPRGGGVGQNFAVCEFIFSSGLVFIAMYLDPPDKHSQNRNPHKTSFFTGNVADEAKSRYFDGYNHSLPQTSRWPEITEIFSKLVSIQGHTIAFGMKVTEEYPVSKDEKVFRGFHFVEMELSCENPRTGAPDRQLVVAVRMPPENSQGENVSNLHIMKQFFSSRHDLRILNQEREQLAAYEYYGVDNAYPYKNPPRQWSRWSPNNEIDIGLVENPSHFSSTHVERHLFRVEDPIEELEKMAAWLQRLLNDSEGTTDDVDMRKFDAFGYIQSRYQHAIGERALREEAGGVYDELNEEESIVGAEPMDTTGESPDLSSSDYANNEYSPMIIN